MKILFEHPVPARLAHGGMQTQIDQTKAALETLGVEVEYLRWWDERQSGDVIHFFGRMSPELILFAQRKGIRVVLSVLLAAQGARPGWKLWLQRHTTRLMRAALPAGLTAAYRWDAYRMADAAIALTPWEGQVLNYLFAVPPGKIHVVPNGVEAEFFAAPPAERGPWLVCTGTITERKRMVELAEAALLARTPLWVVGKPYAESDPYAQRFLHLARQHPDLLRYEGPILARADLARVYRQARGFVLLSENESLSLSALEAAACQCPLLLSDHRWARSAFAAQASYAAVPGSPRATAQALRQFYDAAPRLTPPAKPPGWRDVAAQLKGLYESL